LKVVDRKAACAALEEIETDIVSGLIEKYRDGKVDDFGYSVVLVRHLIEIRESVCGEPSTRA